MGRDTGRHAHRDPFRAVDQQVRKAYRKDLRLLLRLVEVRHKVHDILVQIRQISVLCHLGKASFRVTHGSRAVSLNRAEIPVAVNQNHSLFEFLGHDNESLVDGAVAVGMIFTHGISHDTSALPVRAVIAYP